MFLFRRLTTFAQDSSRVICSTLSNCFHAHLPKASSATAHDLTLANKFGIKLGSIEREINVKVDTVKSTLGGIHAFKVFFEILS
jgi:hypothetical protein